MPAKTLDTPRHSPAHSAVALGFGACALLLLSGCQKKVEAPTPEVVVQAVQPRQGEISDTIDADAIFSPLAEAAISPKITASVKKFLVQRGAHVKAGQLLATLENSDLAAAVLDNEGAYTAAKAGYETAIHATVPEDYSKAKLDLTQATANLDLNRSIVKARAQLFAQGAIPGRDLDTANAALVQAQASYDIAKQHFESVQKTSNKASLDSARGQLDSAKGKYLGAQAELSYTEIRSPIDGVVTDRPLFAGETAAAGTPVITVMDTSALIAKLHIAQVQAQHLSVGAVATISVPGVDDPVEAKVLLVSPALDPASTTVEVWLRVENRKGLFKAGTPVHASITGRIAGNALSIPAEALQTAQDGSKFIMGIAADETAHKHPVSVGIQTPKEVQVLSGITAKDTVITVGAYALDDGTKVKIGAAADEKPTDGKGGDNK
jgi:multidrug efflux pump subunit AcrA (membrane-fusion protein)